MTLNCPCCKATNDTATCRRCKADLSLMADLEAQRDRLLNRAKSLVRDGNLQQAGACVRSAVMLRRDAESERMQALLTILSPSLKAAPREGILHG